MPLHHLFAAVTLAGTLLVASTPAFAQSATDDSDLFPEDEQFLRFGNETTNVVISPFIQLDGGYTEIEGLGGTVDEGFDAKVRLARLYVFLNGEDVGGTFAFNFHDTDFDVAYAFASLDVTDDVTVKIGQQDQPFSLQDMSGRRFLPFAEAGQSAALIPGDNAGITAFYYGERFSLAGGAFIGDVNTGLQDEGVALTGRATYAPIYEEGRITRGGDATKNGVGTQRVERLLHLGVGASARFDIEQDVSFAGGGSSSLVETSLASTETFTNVDVLLRGNLELAYANGSFGVQGELTGVHLDGIANGRRVEGFGHGAYLYATYFLTGERRGYSPSSGTFGRVVPIDAIDDGGFGAIEVGARVDYLDLSDLGPDGGAQIGASLVVNDYLTKRIVLTGDYSYTRLIDGPAEGADVHALTARFQFAY